MVCYHMKTAKTVSQQFIRCFLQGMSICNNITDLQYNLVLVFESSDYIVFLTITFHLKISMIFSFHMIIENSPHNKRAPDRDSFNQLYYRSDLQSDLHKK